MTAPDDAPVKLEEATRRHLQRLKDHQEAWVNDIVVEGARHGLDIPTRTEDEWTHLDHKHLPATVPWGMAMSLADVRSLRGFERGRVSLAQDILQLLHELDEGLGDDATDEDRADAVRAFVDKVLDDLGECRVLVDIVR